MQSGDTDDSMSHSGTGNCSSKFMDTPLPLGLISHTNRERHPGENIASDSFYWHKQDLSQTSKENGSVRKIYVHI